MFSAALKLAKDADGDKWVQQQHETFQRLAARRAATAPKACENTAAHPQAKPAVSGAGSAGAPVTGPDGIAAADRQLRRGKPDAAAAGACPPPRRPLKPAAQNQQLHHSQLQPANSGSVGCPAGSQAGGSIRSGSQPAGGIRAVVSHATRRLIAASDGPQQGKQQRKPAVPTLMAERPSGLGRNSSRGDRRGAGLLQPLQLGGSQEPNSSAFTAGTGGSGRHHQRPGSQRELIPPISVPSAVIADGVGGQAADEQTPMPTDSPAAAADSNEAAATAGVADDIATQAGGDAAPLNEAAIPIAVNAPAAPQQQQHRTLHGRAQGAAVGCLAACNLLGNAAAEVATAAVQQELERVLAGRQKTSAMSITDQPRLKQDLGRCGCHHTVLWKSWSVQLTE